MNAQDFNQLTEFLKTNLMVRISRGGSFDPNTLKVELILDDQVISSDTVDITAHPEYEG